MKLSSSEVCLEGESMGDTLNAYAFCCLASNSAFIAAFLSQRGLWRGQRVQSQLHGIRTSK
eukprot:scaffold3009_cov152-Skeletonema_marinoi.AAC.4